MSDFRPEGYDNPAFRVRRETYDVVTGGDYVRGSEEGLPATALRMPSFPFDISAAIGTGLLFTKPYVDGSGATDYHTIAVSWGWPTAIEMTWNQIALVRSSYGVPASPDEGVTVFHKTRAELGGTDPDTGEPILMPNPPIFLDQGLPSGWWYYHALFFKVASRWDLYMSDACLLPTNYGHQDHLWDALPPYYRWVDDNYRVGDGFLRRFLDIYGFYMDNVRGFVDSLRDLHRTDVTPMSLLKHLGANYGLPYEQGLGDIRYRAMVANISTLQQRRGTAVGLEELVETASKYGCDVTPGANHMLVNDDSDFATGTGNWTALHPATNVSLTVVAWEQVNLVKNTGVPLPAGAPGCRGSMRVDTPNTVQTTSLMITVGDGYVYDHVNFVAVREVIPLYAGIPCEEGETFAFSIWTKVEKAATTITPYLLWFDVNGQPTSYLSKIAGAPLVTADLNWHQVQVSDVAPEDAVYVIPAIYISTRQTGGAVAGRSPWIDFAASMVYTETGDTPVTTIAPDRYLTLGVVTEKLGEPMVGFDGFLIGAPQEGS